MSFSSQLRLVAGFSSYQPRLSTDQLFLPNPGCFQFDGPLDQAIHFIQEHQLLDAALWTRFTDQFRTASDDDLGWRCEYWGKLMRGGTMVYAYTQDAALYQQLEATVRDMLSTQDPLGRFSTYSVSQEFQGWDLWGRKYILLGMEHFYDVCRDEDLKKAILAALLDHTDYIIAHIGEEPGKKDIRYTSNFWEGMNSSSLLEPVVRLYNMTGEKRFLEFARYIVDQGAIRSANLFRLALENQLDPWQYPVTKAYEMMSCFEGLLEYARATENAEWGQAAVNFGRRVLASDITVIGSAGCTHELFDHSRLGQADPAFTGIMQETCVTVTWMKLCCQLLLYTGDAVFGDEMERSAYNALLGAVNTEKISGDPLSPHGWLPFDSYSPLRVGHRGQAVGGRMVMADNTIYGCCAAIAAAGLGLVPSASALLRRDGIGINLYLPGTMGLSTPAGQEIKIQIETNYPMGETVSLCLSLQEPEKFTLSLRIPSWCSDSQAKVNGKAQPSHTGWLEISRLWADGDRIDLLYPMPVKALYAHQLGQGAKQLPPYLSLSRGPVVLARDEALGGPALGSSLEISADFRGVVAAKKEEPHNLPFPVLQAWDIPLSQGDTLRLVDYASAGKDYSRAIEAWIPTKGIE